MRIQYLFEAFQEGLTPLLYNSKSSSLLRSRVAGCVAFCLESKHGQVSDIFATRLDSKQNGADLNCCLDSKQNIHAPGRRPGPDANHKGELLMMS